MQFSTVRKWAKVVTLVWVVGLITFAVVMTFTQLSLVNAAIAGALSTVVGIFSYVTKVLVDQCDRERDGS